MKLRLEHGGTRNVEYESLFEAAQKGEPQVKSRRGDVARMVRIARVPCHHEDCADHPELALACAEESAKQKAMSATKVKNLDPSTVAELETPPCPGCGDDPSVDCCCVYQTDFMDSDGQAYSDELMNEYDASRQPMYEEWHDMIFNRRNGDEREHPRTCGHSDCAACPELQEACMASTGNGRRRYGSLAAVEVDHPRSSRFYEVAKVAFRDYDARTVEEHPEFCDGIYVTFQTRFSLEARGRS